MDKTEIKAYHDAYETEFGDGFYPFIEETTGSTPVILRFVLKNKEWKQVSGINIKGIDGKEGGYAFLLRLGSDATAIYNTYGKQVYPKL